MLGRETLPWRMGKGGARWKSVSHQRAAFIAAVPLLSEPRANAAGRGNATRIQSQTEKKPPATRPRSLCCGCGPGGQQSTARGSPQSLVPPALQCRAPTTARRAAWRGLCAALVALKGLCNFYCFFPRSDNMFWRNVHYLRCSV